MINLKRIIPRNLREEIMYALSFLPDEPYIKLFYYCTTGRKLNLKNPKGFNEKLNWLKLHDKHLEYSQLADKYAVREHINRVLGEGHLFPLLGKWERFEDIDFSSLPDRFVLKCNHDSGSVKIIHDKSLLTEKEKRNLQLFYNKRLKRNFFYAGREYCYKGIDNRYILAEQLMEEESNPGGSIEDFKFYCFDGKPLIMLIVTDRETDCRFDYFDMNFHHLDIMRRHPNAGKRIEKPAMFEEMKQIATVLSQEMRCVRIDLYQLNGKIYFGEYTFFPGGGFELFRPNKWERQLGEFIHL